MVCLGHVHKVPVKGNFAYKDGRFQHGCRGQTTYLWPYCAYEKKMRKQIDLDIWFVSTILFIKAKDERKTLLKQLAV